MRDEDALRLARGARGVQHVGCIGTLQGGGIALDRLVHGFILRAVDKEEAGRRQRKELGRLFRDDDDRRPRILDHEGEPLGGIGRVERHVSAARLEYGEKRGHQFQRPVQANGHKCARSHTRTAQPLGQLFRLHVQFAIGPLFIAKNHGDRLGRARRLLLKKMVNARVLRKGHLRVVPVVEQLRVLHFRQERKAADLTLGHLRHRPQHDVEVIAEGLNLSLVQPRGIVMQFNPQRVQPHHDHERSFDLLARDERFRASGHDQKGRQAIGESFFARLRKTVRRNRPLFPGFLEPGVK
jgi:hypothetical protein